MSIEAEQAVLGALLAKPDLMDTCYLQGEDFSPEENHGLIMDSLRWAYDYFANKPNPFDLVLLAEYWGSQLAKIGGISYLVQLQKSFPMASNFEQYQTIVRKAHIDRQARKALHTALTRDDINLADTLEDLQKLADMRIGPDRSGPVLMADTLVDHHKVLRDRASRMGLTGAKTASTELDQMSGGHQKGDLIIIAARPSIGKTAFIVSDTIQSAGTGTTTVIFSAEMPGADVTERHICAIGGIDSAKMRTGRLSETDWVNYDKALDMLDNLPLYIDDTPGMSIEYIRRQVKMLKKKFPRLIVYIDYLQLIESEKSFTNNADRVNYVSKQLKQMARVFDIPVVAISSVGRKCEERQDKRPMMSDLRESGNIEFDADIIIFLYRDDYYYPDTVLKGVIELIVAKGRKIGTRTIQMLFNRKNGRFTDLDKDALYELMKKAKEKEQEQKRRR
ncbi:MULTISPECIES: replicative DNA helicase [unclassified Paenibacillus]|uniref:replicative DNA helicase n=1 Tax=unclassified Paenibacillus TaxID=185978 RepID=UPI00240730D6|nr:MULTISPECIES: replicative DNA helicase [unclassified Paenibacillus]MDF9845118.1 replicative DNA helicase [Paenibacillus sp. PastF-2]MDF9851717.1 replicative DNA helicase [Paenibacillus sp. PastM-2]MDF9858330.1 replicative DNA helicase [Paenibacillus sp. PastF-1]MDH6483590.1 replicative DNA helicase [Paenibacillus sp. PastH-2]MDH6511005.1 replicative DNA helicase [Paenibacillus sp. PastM-3]